MVVRHKRSSPIAFPTNLDSDLLAGCFRPSRNAELVL
jgi:hypothetical protein